MVVTFQAPAKQTRCHDSKGLRFVVTVYHVVAKRNIFRASLESEEQKVPVLPEKKMLRYITLLLDPGSSTKLEIIRKFLVGNNALKYLIQGVRIVNLKI